VAAGSRVSWLLTPGLGERASVECVEPKCRDKPQDSVAGHQIIGSHRQGNATRVSFMLAAGRSRNNCARSG